MARIDELKEKMTVSAEIREKFGYSIRKRNGDIHYAYSYVSKEVAEQAFALGQARGWGWSIVEHTDDDIKDHIIFCAWYNGGFNK